MNFDRFRIDDITMQYLKGEAFAATYAFDTGKQVSILKDRLSLLSELAQDKRILHIGCCDHLGLIETKMLKGNWLHKLLHEVASELVGLDIDKEAIKYLNSNYPQYRVEYADILNPLPDFLKGETFDFVFLPETLEHIPNPGDFLLNLHQNYRSISKELIITVPNALKKINRKNGTHFELINTDHRFWFTPYTLAKNLTTAGFKINWFTYAMYGRHKASFNPMTIMKHRYLKRNPSAQDIIVMCCEF